MSSDTSLVFNLIGRDRVSGDVRQVERSFLGLKGSLKPLLGALPAAGAGVANFAAIVGNALAGAAVSVGVLGLAVAPQIAAMKDAGAAQDAYNKAVLKYGQDSKQAQQALKYTNALMGQMPSATRQSAVAFGNLKTQFGQWSDSLASSTMPIFTMGIQALSRILPTLTPIVKSAAAEVGGLVSKFADFTKTAKFRAFMKDVADWAARGLSRTVGWIEKLADKAEGFATGGGLQKFIQFAKDNGPVLADLLKNLATFVGNFVKASSDSAATASGGALSLMQLMSAALAAIPQSFLRALAPIITGVAVAYGIATVAIQIHDYYLKIHTFWTKAAAVGTAIWEGAQWLLNAALGANPIVLIVLAIIALVAIIVVIATKTTWFQRIWAGTWAGIKLATLVTWHVLRDDVFNPITHFFTRTIPGAASTLWSAVSGAFGKMKSSALGMYNYVHGKVDSLIGLFRGIPGRITSATRGMFNGITSAFKSAVNAVIRGWNGLSFHIPGVSVGPVHFGGFTLSTPNIPYLAKGGVLSRSGSVVVGDAGPEILSLPRGAQVTPLSRAGGESRTVIEIRSGGSRLDEVLIGILQEAIRAKGGNVQVVLGH